ncbi:hypothetical protein N1851_030667 [Merluccius polli]|uniref:Uncharacterized protein n=1 Tax=Merluccius polli TaxID=89951 RepID=A0AA47NQP4_MERPO|nr:hypothetical protein N1851_030667 [Merluccius polli]
MKPSPGPWWWRLVCFSAAFLSGSNTEVQKREKTSGAAATREDVDVLTYGVTQLGHSLVQVNETTEAQMNAIGRSLFTYEGWLWLLGEEAQRAAEAQQHVKEAQRQLQVQMVGVQAQSWVTLDTLAHVEWEDQELWTRVWNVAFYLDAALPAHIELLQEKAAMLSDIIRMLQIFTEYQRASLDGQNQQLSRLQRMVGLNNG